MEFRSRMVSVGSLAHDADPCCVLDVSFRFLSCNPAWDRFAEANGGGAAALGRALRGHYFFELVPEVVRPFFCYHFQALREGGCVWYHRFQCSSPTEFRLHELQALYLLDASEFLVYYPTIECRPHIRPAVEPYDLRAVSAPLRICCNCRRTKRPFEPGSWDWVPAYVAAPLGNMVCDLCPGCRAYYQIDLGA